MWNLPGSVNIPLAELPVSSSAKVNGDGADPNQVANTIVESINRALSEAKYNDLSELFAEDSYWRDHLVLTWNFRTIHRRKHIRTFLEDCANTTEGGFRLKRVAVDRSNSVREPKMSVVDFSGTAPCLVVFLSLDTSLGTGEGVIRLVSHGGSWKIYTLYTSLRELRGHEEAIFGRRAKGVDHGDKPGRKNWIECRQEESQWENGKQPAVIILGAGQAGLTVAARLKALGVSSLMVDQNQCIGDNWRKRYHQLVLNNPVWYDHLPYMPFPPQWPIFTPKDKLADFFEAYAKLLDLDAWMQSTIIESKWDDEKTIWTVKIQRKLDDGSIQERILHPRHIIQATGHSGKKNIPEIKGMESFKGHLLCHSSEFPGARENAEGKKAIVVGSCNSGHDIAQDYHEKGYDVTMVQRSSTCIVSSEGITEIGLKALYSENSPHVDDSDPLFHSIPFAVGKVSEKQITAAQAELDKPLLDGLARAGFKLDRGPDDSGLFIKYLQRGGGYYIDVGASRLIADGKIKVKQGQEVVEVLPYGVRFGDGTELEADEVVFATGYDNMRTQTRDIFGDEVADRVGDVWGVNGEGEMRGIWQRSGHPGFWFHGGNLPLCRYYSRLLALQIKAIEVGIAKYDEE
ncbi:hypothetical protein ACRALDRAFT_1054600 [Sodiomyces alcalophilus JCM 7366]|uniref:uncharacterized protein n=1 Tax=Sodiomyces alcalophilus JCM 7366 TaxID=591952 RepID=UPI0039B4EF31